MFAIIRTGGKQYRVSPGQTLQVEKLKTEPGKTVDFTDVLLTSDKETTVGQPLVAGAKVTAKVVTHGRDSKVTGVKFHNKVRYRRTFGHRQDFTTVKIEKISA